MEAWQCTEKVEVGRSGCNHVVTLACHESKVRLRCWERMRELEAPSPCECAAPALRATRSLSPCQLSLFVSSPSPSS